MTIYYSPTTKSFFDTAINFEIPDDKIEVSEEVWSDLTLARSNGKIIEINSKGKPVAVNPPAPTKDQIIDKFNMAANGKINTVATSWGYDSIVSAASYANSTNPQFKAEAEALIAWRDNLWGTAYTIEAGKLPKTVEDFLALLPEAPAKPVI